MNTEKFFSEKVDNYSNKIENCQIKESNTNRSFKELNSFWEKESKRVKEFFDDNGTMYREDKRLLPDNRFEIKGYQYETDNQGRISSAEGQLKIKDNNYSRVMEDVRNYKGQEYRNSDDRGHLIGHQFGGSDRLENLVPMDSSLNQGDYVKLEKTLASAVKDNADVMLKVEPIYENKSTRPIEFKVSYSIDGDKEVTVFKNEREVKT